MKSVLPYDLLIVKFPVHKITGVLKALLAYILQLAVFQVSFEASTEQAYNGGYRCVVFNYQLGKWKFDDCRKRHPTVCEEPHDYPDEYPPGYSKWPVRGSFNIVL